MYMCIHVHLTTGIYTYSESCNTLLEEKITHEMKGPVILEIFYIF